MAAALFVFVAAFLAVVAFAGDLNVCNQNSYTYLGQASAQTWNCLNMGSPSGVVTTTYGMAAPEPLMFFFNPNTALPSPYYSIWVQCDAENRITISGDPSPEPFVVGPCKSLNVSFVSAYIGVSYGFELSWTTEFVMPLMPGVPNTYVAAASPHGSLVSYSFNEPAGANFYINASVFNYDGFVPPQLIEAVGYIPLPGVQNGAVTFVSEGAESYSASFNFNLPSGSFYGFGVELFGGVNNAEIRLIPHWTYSYPSLSSAQHVSGIGAAFYQAQVGTVASITIQLARTNSGGYPVITVFGGSPASGPTVATLTTSVSQNYDSVTINNPWAGSTSVPNPGVLILSVTCEGGGLCGFTTAVTW